MNPFSVSLSPSIALSLLIRVSWSCEVKIKKHLKYFYFFCKDDERDREEGSDLSVMLTPLYTVIKFSKISCMEIVAVKIAETVQFLPKVMRWQLNNQTDYIQFYLLAHSSHSPLLLFNLVLAFVSASNLITQALIILN